MSITTIYAARTTTIITPISTGTKCQCIILLQDGIRYDTYIHYDTIFDFEFSLVGFTFFYRILSSSFQDLIRNWMSLCFNTNRDLLLVMKERKKCSVQKRKFNVVIRSYINTFHGAVVAMPIVDVFYSYQCQSALQPPPQSVESVNYNSSKIIDF